MAHDGKLVRTATFHAERIANRGASGEHHRYRGDCRQDEAGLVIALSPANFST
jgi:hypothetical protein